MKNEMILSFSASLENEPFARTCVASFIAALNPTIDEIVEVKTIVGEAVSNAIIHGYNCDASRTVLIKASVHDQTLMIKGAAHGIFNPLCIKASAGVRRIPRRTKTALRKCGAG